MQDAKRETITNAADTAPRMVSAQTEVTASIMAETGLDEATLHDLVHRFYGKVRRDPVLGPVFAARITN